MIHIVLNGQAHTINQKTSIQELLVSLALQEKRIAVEVNKALVPRSQHSTYYINSNDQVEIVHAIGGG